MRVNVIKPNWLERQSGSVLNAPCELYIGLRLDPAHNEGVEIHSFVLYICYVKTGQRQLPLDRSRYNMAMWSHVSCSNE